jgi:hypothetical protein
MTDGLLHANIRMKNVMVVDGLRVHICPKVATASISAAMHGTKYRHVFPEEQGPEYRWMCVRHPLDRLVSFWSFFCKSDTDHEIKGQHDVLKLGYRYQMPFNEFLDIALQHHYLNAHTSKQTHFAGKNSFDRLCRLENLPQEWAILQEKFPFLVKPLPLTHKSKHDNWQEYYTSSQRSRAEKVFFEDVGLYENACG